ncbi:hypothetical protein E7V67_009325 [[Empedobacter] haloabium]|uniref:Sel1 repeat family protein n=1 Tax=[Empedobacter] haloabium TaxID=592317 RepID=A0ABZ1UR98_9BURK
MTSARKTVGLIGAAAALAAAAWFGSDPATQQAAAASSTRGAEGVAAGAPARGDAGDRLSSRPGSSLDSPFARGGAGRPDPEQMIRERAALMKQLGLATPPEYDRMSLAQLKEKAHAKDIFALLQLGVQYQYQNNGLEFDPDYDFGKDPQLESKRYLTEAVNAGHIHASTILAKQYAESGDTVEAYAWNTLAERLWDTSNKEWSKTAFAGLTPEQRMRGEQRANELFIAASQRFLPASQVASETDK